MKHTANRSKLVVGAKSKNLTQVKVIARDNSTAKKSVGKVAASDSKSQPQKAEIASKTSTRTRQNLKEKVALESSNVSKKLVAAKKPAAPQKAEFQSTAAPKNKSKAAAKSSPETVIEQISKAKTQKSNLRLPKAETTIAAEKKLSVENSEPVVAEKRAKKAEPLKPTSTAKAADRKTDKIPAAVPKKNVEKMLAMPVVTASEKNVRKIDESNQPIGTKQSVRKTSKTESESSAIALKNPADEKSAIEKDDSAKISVEEIKPRPAKPKKAKPIGAAVFRGKKERYDFKMFALNEIFEPIPAVYIISKRKTDRNKRGHHALICIGATSSISEELKRHRKGKCVKKHAANVVSILPEADEKVRLKIETDLKAAHAVVCNLE